MHKIMTPMLTLLLTLSVSGVLSIAGLSTAMADSDHQQARQLLESGEILPLETILTRLRQTHPGRIIEVELEKHKKQLIYEIEILSADGLVTKVKINAKTGDIISSKKDD